MYCPKCGGEYRANVLMCAMCQIALVNEKPVTGDKFSPVAMEEALAGRELRGVLEGAFIPVFEAQRSLSSAGIMSLIADDAGQPVAQGTSQQFFLMVAEGDHPQARNYFKTLWEQGRLSLGLNLIEELAASTDACPACGSPLSESVAECGDCGLVVG